MNRKHLYLCLLVFLPYFSFGQTPVIDSVHTTPQVCTGATITIYTASTIGVSYSITGPQSAGSQSSNVFNDVASGTYTVVATNSNGSTTLGGIVVDDSSSALQLPTLETFPPTCPNGNDGYVVITVNGGKPNYSLTIDAGPVLPPTILSGGQDTIFGLSPATNYNLEIIDDCGQEINQGFSVPNKVLQSLTSVFNTLVSPASYDSTGCGTFKLTYWRNVGQNSLLNQAYPIQYDFISLTGSNSDTTILLNSPATSDQEITMNDDVWRIKISDACGRMDSIDRDLTNKILVYNLNRSPFPGTCVPSMLIRTRFSLPGEGVFESTITNCDILEFVDTSGVVVATLDSTNSENTGSAYNASYNILPGSGTYTMRWINTCCQDTLESTDFYDFGNAEYVFAGLTNNVAYDSTAGIQINYSDMPFSGHYIVFDSITGPDFYAVTPFTANNVDTNYAPPIGQVINLPTRSSYNLGSFPPAEYHFRMGNSTCLVEDTFSVLIQEPDVTRFEYFYEFVQGCEGLSEMDAWFTSAPSTQSRFRIDDITNSVLLQNVNVFNVGDTINTQNLSSSTEYKLTFRPATNILEIYADEYGSYIDTFFTPLQPLPSIDSIVADCDGLDSALITVYASGVAPFDFRYRDNGAMTFNPYQDSATFYLTEQEIYEFQVQDACGNTSAIFESGVCLPPCDSLGVVLEDSFIEASCLDDISPAALGTPIIDTTCCPGGVTITYTDSISDYFCPNSYTINRIWTTQDECGNSAVEIQVIVLTDTIAPTFLGTLPSDTTINCTESITAPVLSAQEECGYVPMVTYHEDTIAGSCPNSYTIQRTWMASDSCSNIASHTQYITVQDTTPPTFDTTPPSDTISVTCYQDIPSATIITASDECGIAQVIVDENRVEGGCSGQFTIERTWVAIDECNNITVSDTQYVIVNDTVAPTFNEALPADTIISCSDSIPVADTLTAYDCTDGNIYNIPALTNDYYLDMGKIIATYNSDNDGFGVIYENVSVASILEGGTPQAILDYYDTIYVSLTTSPVTGTNGQNVKRNNFGYRLLNSVVTLSFSHDVTFQVSGNPSLNAKEKLTFSGDGNLFYPFPESGGTNWGEDWIEPDILTTLTNPYIAYNSGSVTHNRAGQVFGGTGTNLTFQQENPNGAIAQLFVSVFEPKSNVSAQVDFSETISPGSCPSNYVITRTWTATDSCGNQNMHTQTITVQDTVAPVFTSSLLADTLWTSCTSIPQPETLTATDNCGTVDILVDELQINVNCWSDYTLKRDYIAFDACGNTDTLTQYIIVVDTVAPVFDFLPSDTLYFSCDQIIPEPDSLTVTEECVQDFARWISYDKMVNGFILNVNQALKDYDSNCDVNGYNSACDGYGMIVNGALVSDYLLDGNLLPPSQTILDYFNGVTFNITTDTLPLGAGTRYVTSDNGFSGVGFRLNNASYVITFSDPVMYMLNGDPSTEAGASLNFYGDYDLLVPYGAHHNWPGSQSFSQSGIIADLTAPDFSIQNIANTNIGSNRKMAGGFGTTFGFSAKDGSVARMFETYLYVPDTLVTYTEDTIVGGCPNEMEIHRTWSSTDSCGNQNTFTQVLVIQDTVAPIFDQSLPTDTLVNCDAVPTVMTLTATDNCSDVAVAYTEDTLQGGCLNNYTLTRTWTATDSCGNQTIHVQTVTVQDTVAPVFDQAVLPSDTTVSCDVIPTPAVLTASDNCSAVSIVMVEDTVSGTCPTVFTLTRTWTASDSCGNFVSHSQVINVIDTLAPIFSTYPSDTVLNNDTDLCSAVLNWTEPLVSDNCGGITIVSSHANGSAFPVGTTNVVYVATDDCGNADSITFSVTVVDVQKPNVSIQVSPNFCEGDAVSWVEMIDDNCGVDTIISSHSMSDDFTVGTTTVTYTVTDIHGNDSTYTFDVVVSPLPIVEFVQSDVVGCLTDNILLEVNNPNTDYTYDWMFDGMYIGSGPYYTINSSEYADAGVYSVEVYTNEGCVDTFNISVALELCDIVIVETFSPNGDGINDYFTIDNIEAYPGTSVKIFNRWGALVYESDNYLNEWDGTSMNSLNIGGNELPEGTYYYILQLSGNEGELYKGYVYLKR